MSSSRQSRSDRCFIWRELGLLSVEWVEKTAHREGAPESDCKVGRRSLEWENLPSTKWTGQHLSPQPQSHSQTDSTPEECFKAIYYLPSWHKLQNPKRKSIRWGPRLNTPQSIPMELHLPTGFIYYGSSEGQMSTHQALSTMKSFNSHNSRQQVWSISILQMRSWGQGHTPRDWSSWNWNLGL